MPTPSITTSTRFFHPDTTKCYYLPAVANISAPTRLEMNAGTDLSNEVADIAGWSVTANEIPTPDLGTIFTSKIPGRTDAEDSSITFYADLNGVDVRALLPRGTNGFIMWLDGGDVEDNIAAVFPVRVRSVANQRSLGDEAARLMVQFSITREPAEDVAVPALT